MIAIVKKQELKEKFPKINILDDKSTPFNVKIEEKWVSGDILPISISLLGYSPKSFLWFKTKYKLHPPNFKTTDPKDGELLWKVFYLQNEEKVKEAKENYCIIQSYEVELIAKQLKSKFLF